MRTVPSRLPVARRAPSGLKAAPLVARIREGEARLARITIQDFNGLVAAKDRKLQPVRAESDRTVTLGCDRRSQQFTCVGRSDGPGLNA
ncbi:MAG TPA: hypothetical protein VF823_00295 [Anaerolineales bacterium]